MMGVAVKPKLHEKSVREAAWASVRHRNVMMSSEGEEEEERGKLCKQRIREVHLPHGRRTPCRGRKAND